MTLAAPFKVSVPLRRSDFVATGHLYHGDYLAIIDEARGKFFDQVIRTPNTSYLVARIEIDFLEMVLPDRSTVDVRIETLPQIGKSSFTLLETVSIGDTVHARTRTVVVMWDLAKICSRNILEEERHELHRHAVAPQPTVRPHSP